MKKKHAEYQYLDLGQEILDDGSRIVDRGTNIKLKSLFGRQMRFDLTSDFPLLTTKKVYWKGVTHELYWFMSGQTNIKYLVDNNVHIWDDYPYKIYMGKVKKGLIKDRKNLTKDEFIERVKEDKKFAKNHGELPRIYGEMWRHWPARHARQFAGVAGRPLGEIKGIDQLGWVLEELKDDPNAKNLIVNSWNPEYLY